MAPHCSDQSIGRSVRRLMQNPALCLSVFASLGSGASTDLKPDLQNPANPVPLLKAQIEHNMEPPEVGNAPLARIIELTDLCATARACALVRLRSPRGGAPRHLGDKRGLGGASNA